MAGLGYTLSFTGLLISSCSISVSPVLLNGPVPELTNCGSVPDGILKHELVNEVAIEPSNRSVPPPILLRIYNDPLPLFRLFAEGAGFQ